MTTRRLAAMLGVLALLVGACGDGASGTTTTSTPGVDSVIAEFMTPDGSTYRALLHGDAATHARAAHAAGEYAGIPNGVILPGDGGINIGHEWHVTEVEWADVAIELCDGNAGYIDDLGYEEFVNQHGDRFCPWDAQLIDLIEP